MSESAYLDCFLELDELLAKTSQWWQIGSFQQRDFPWRAQAPEFIDQLISLDEHQLKHLESDSQGLAQWLEPWVGDGQRLLQLSQLDSFPKRQLRPAARLEAGVKGRKWAQIQQLAASIPAASEPTLEWCSGKGHLGRLIASVDGAPVTSLEWQSALCTAGQEQAYASSISQRFLHLDARSEQAAVEVGRHQRVLALHACGSLHTGLLKYWAKSDSRCLALAPCCYHLIDGESYVPLSEQARRGRVRLTKRCLSLPLQEEVTAGATVRRQRKKELLWRMAFDEWQREARGRDEYLPLPGFSRRLLAAGFTDFLQWAATRKELEAPCQLDESIWLERGARRAERVRLIELVMHLFRRPLEMWLVLDQVLYLQHHGARVSLGEFCGRLETPRNIMIYAER